MRRGIRHSLSLVCILPAVLSAALGAAEAQSAKAAPAPPNLRLVTSPQLVDVGQNVVFSLTASRWPAPASAKLSFLSPHHGFSGSMLWASSCGCFTAAVHLATRVHPLESGMATAVVRYSGNAFTIHTTFMIRGLAPGGRTYAPGGTTSLTAFVTDPNPTQDENEHFCAWVTTLDGLGVAGIPVRFTAHFPDGNRHWNAGSTPATGLTCIHHSVGTVTPGTSVRVDAQVGSMRAHTTFTVRA